MKKNSHRSPVLVTGGAGFIGSHLVDALVQQGHRVRVLDNLSAGIMRNLEQVRGKIDFIRGDLRNPRLLKKAVSGVEVVYHQAALRSVPKSVNKPLEYHEINATGTLCLLLEAKKAGVRRVVYASSSSIYGDDVPNPQKETFLPKPQSPYAASKLASEIYGGLFTRLHGLETVGLRYFNVFGPRQSLESTYAMLVPQFITDLFRGHRPPIYGTGKQTRDFTHVANVVQANLKAATTARVAGEVFNVGNGKRYSVIEATHILISLTGASVKPRFLPKRPGDVMHTQADISKARKLLGYDPQVSFEQGLKDSVNWFAANRWAWKGR